MAKRLGKYLGVAISDQGILVAEVANAGGRREVKKYDEFVFPEGTSASALATAGVAFGKFLKQHGFHSRDAVIGLPARWVVIKPKDLPPADPETAATLLRVQAEGEFSADLKEMVYDYAGESHPKQPRQVLLMGVPKERLEAIHAFAEAARMQVVGITPSVAALAAVSKTLAAPEGVVVYLGGKTAELAVQTGYGLQRIRHFAMATPGAGAVGGGIAGVGDGGAAGTLAAGGATGVTGGASPELVSELRRTFAGLPQNGTPPGDRKLVLWDGSGLDDKAQAAIGSRLGMEVHAQNLTAMGVGGTDLNAKASRFAQAVALASVLFTDAGLPADFDDPRLAPPKESSTGQKVSVGVLVGVLVAAVIGFLWWQSYQDDLRIATLSKQVKTNQPQYVADQALVKRLDQAKGWFGGAANPYLDCFVAVTKAFPNTNNCYATNLDLSPLVSPLRDTQTARGGGAAPAAAGAASQPLTGLKGTLSGKCGDKEAANQIAKALQQSGDFLDAKVASVVKTSTPGGAAQGTGRGNRGAGTGGNPGGGRNDARTSSDGDYNFQIEFTFSRKKEVARGTK